MTNKVETFTAKPIDKKTNKPKQERQLPFKKWWSWLKNFLGSRYLVNYIVYTGIAHIPYKNVVTGNELEELLNSQHIFVYSVVSKKYLSTIHKKVVDSDEKINAHTDVSEQLQLSKFYDNMR